MHFPFHHLTSIVLESLPITFLWSCFSLLFQFTWIYPLQISFFKNVSTPKCLGMEEVLQTLYFFHSLQQKHDENLSTFLHQICYSEAPYKTLNK